MKIAKRILTLVLVISLCVFAFPLEKANAETVMTAAELVSKCLDIAANYPTVYGNGGGRSCGEWYDDVQAFSFDCSGLIKTILWGWNGNKYAAFGGATYLANGVADLDDSGIWNHCYDKAEINFSDLSAILPGEVLWMSGHVGVYVGNGYVVEASPIVNGGVQKLLLSNANKETTSNLFTHHGKLDYISYSNSSTKVLSKTSTDALNWLQSKVGQTIDYDGSWGGQCVDLIYAYYNFLGVAVQGGNARDYATNFLPDGLERIPNCAQPKLGDILIYAGGTGYGHVAIYESDTVTWHQNYANHQYVERVTNVNYKIITGDGGAGYWGVIRPNFGNSTSVAGTIWKDGDISVSTSETARPTISTTNPQIRGWLTYDTSRKFVQGGLFFGTSKTDVENATPSNYTHSGTWFVSDTNESGLPYQTAGSSKRSNLFYDISSAPTDGFGKPSLTPNAYYYKFYARMDNGEVCCSKTFSYIVPAKVTVTQESGGKITQGQSGSYTPGETITLTAVPNSGYSFGHWSSSNGGTFADAKAASTTFIVPKADTTVTAHFSNEPVYAITAAPSTLDFGTLQTGYASVGKTITIQNTGNQTLVLNTQGQPAHFTVTGHGKTTLLPGESTTAIVKPREGLGAGKYDALIYITTNTDIAAAPLNLKLTVLKSPAAITTASLPDAVLGDPYSYALTATGDAPITWTISSGTLPNGLTLAENGNITGIPTVAGKYTFTVKASNGAAADATAELTLLVTSGSVSENSPKLTTKALTGGRVTDYQNTGFAPGTVIYLSALPSEGFAFVRWIPSTDGLSIDEAAADITLVMPEENVTLTAVFRVKETDWSETKPANVTCLSKTQYSQRVKQTTTSTTQLSGWTLDQTAYGEWSAWSAWSTTAAAKTELQDVETKTTEATYKTVYKYNHYKYWNSQANTYYYSYGSGYASGGTWEYITLDYPLTAGQVYDGYTSYYYNGQIWFNQTTEQQQLTAAKTEYRYRTRNKIYHYSRWTEWSAWQEAPLTAGSTTEVRQRTLYKPDPSSVTLPYCLRVKKSEQGVISAIGGAYNAGDVIAIKATPNSGYRFVKWKGDGKAYFADADSPETTLLMTASDTTVSAVYEALLRAEMPGWLTQIEAEAFMGNTHLEYVTIPEPCTSIGERAFAGCTGLYEVHIAHPNAQIAESAFKDCPNLTIYGTNGSTAQQYAQAHSIPFAAE